MIRRFFLTIEDEETTKKRHIKINNQYLGEQLCKTTIFNEKVFYLYTTKKKILSYKCKIEKIKGNDIYLKLLEICC